MVIKEGLIDKGDSNRIPLNFSNNVDLVTSSGCEDNDLARGWTPVRECGWSKHSKENVCK